MNKNLFGLLARATVALGLLLVFGFAQTASAQDPPLNFGDNFFVTGDYVVAGAQNMTTQVAGGFATGTINIPDANPGITGTKSVPPGAQVVAAFLYWQTVEKVGVMPGEPGSGQNGFFRPVFQHGPQTGYAITGVNLNSQTTVSFSSGGCTGSSTGKLLRTYRAEVRAFLPQDSQGNILVNTDNTGFNGHYEVRLPSTGNNTPLTLGATLVIIYRVLSPNFPLNSIVIYDGPYAPGNAALTMTQTVQGFYDADGKVTRLTHIVGGGKSNKFQTVSFGSPNNIVALESLYGSHDPAFPGYYGTWDNPTWTFPDPANQFIGNQNPMQAGAASATTEVVPSSSNQGCVSWGAVIVSTTVESSDNDGLLDIWKNNPNSPNRPGYCDASFKEGVCNPGDPTWVDLPGAKSGEKDVFVQIDYMCSDPTPAGPNPCDTSASPPDLLSAASPGSGGAFSESGGYTTYTITGGGACFAIGTAITIAGFTNTANNGQFTVASCSGSQLVVSNAKGVLDNSGGTATFTNYSFDPRLVVDPSTGMRSDIEVAAMYANKGITLHPEWHAMQETAGCIDTEMNGIPSYCPFLYQPGLVGWKGGFDALKSQPLNLNPDGTNWTEAQCEANTAACIRRFQHGRKDSYHEVIFAHAEAGSEWSFQQGTLTSVTVSGRGKTVTFTTLTPHLLVQASSMNDQNPLARVTVSDAVTDTMLSGTYLVQSVPTPTTFTIQLTNATSVPSFTPLTDPGLSVASGRIHTRSGFSDVGGADSVVTLGLWDPTLAKQVTGPTFAHEFGHANGLTHGGFYYDNLAHNDYRATVEANCKPNFQSVMNYPFQLAHLDTGASFVVDYSEEQLDTLTESNLPGAVTVGGNPPFYQITQWYTPTKPVGGTPAKQFCDGTPVPLDITMYQVGGPADPIGLGTPPLFGSGIQLALTPPWQRPSSDVNFDDSPTNLLLNIQDDTMRGHSDWTNVVNPANGLITSPGIDLRQVGATGADAFGGGGTLGPGGGPLGPGGGPLGPGGGPLGPGGGTLGPGGGPLGPGGGPLGPGGGPLGPGGGVGEVDITTATGVTFAPSHLTATEAASPRTITLNWAEAFGLIGAYNVYRSANGGSSFALIHTVVGNPPATTFADSVTCNPNGYQYFVTAVQSSSSPNPGQESGPSNLAFVGQSNEKLTGCYLPPVFLTPAAGSSPQTGSVVPATWTVQDASNSSGTFATNPASNTLVAIGPISNDVVCVPGNVPAGTPRSTLSSGGTGITFASNQFTFSWNTAQGFAGGGAFPPGCYLLEVDLDSGQPAAGMLPASLFQPSLFQQQLYLSDVNESVLVTTTSASLSNAVVGAPYSLTLQESGGVPPVTWTLKSGSGPLPAGITLNSASGTLSGTPTTAGKYPFTIQVTDSIGDFGTQPLTLVVLSGDLIIVDGSPSAKPLVGTLLRVTPGGTSSTIANILNMSPTGVAVDPSTGNIYAAVTVPPVGSGTASIVKVTASGMLSNFTSGSPLLNPVAVAVDASGNVYVADNSTHATYKFNPSGTQVDANGNSTPNAFAPLPKTGNLLNDIRMAFDSSGNLIVASDSISGVGGGPIEVDKISSSGVFAVLYNTTTNSNLSPPITTVGGIAPLSDGSIDVADFSAQAIYKITNPGAAGMATSTAVGPTAAVCCNITGMANRVSQVNTTLYVTLNSAAKLQLAVPDTSSVTTVLSGAPLTFPNDVAWYDFPAPPPQGPPPLPATGLTVSGVVQATSVSLTWTASTTATVVGYNVYRGTTSGGPYTKLNASPVAATNFTDTPIASGVYYYVVTAVDSNNLESVFSNEVSANP